MSKRVVFFGSIPVARECLELLLEQDDVTVVGVCAIPLDSDWRGEQSVWDYCVANSIPLIEHDQIPALSPDLGVSVRYHHILRKDTLDAFPDGVVNVHGGLLPEYRGSYCNIHAIVNDESEFGVTLHYLDEGVDTGDIVARLSVPIDPSDTGLTLYRKGEQLCVQAIEQNLRSLIDGRAERTTQRSLIENGAIAREYKRSDLTELRSLASSDVDKPRALRIVRAFDSPFHEPAYMDVGDERIYLRSSW